MRRCLVLYGLTCSIGQVLALRELAVACQGNELVYGAALALWLLLAAAGSGLLAPLAVTHRLSVPALALNLAGVGALAPATLVLIRALRWGLAGSAGVALSFGQTLLLAALSLAPLCLALGFFFALACAVESRCDPRPGAAAARVFVFEALGMFLGGVAFTFMLVHLLDALLIALLLAAVANLAAFALWFYDEGEGWRWGWAFLLTSAVAFGAVLSPLGRVLDFATQTLRFPERTLRESKDTPYGRLDVVENRDQTEFYENGVLAGATHTESAAEERVLPPLLAHPRPMRLLLIGGYVTGAVEAALAAPWLQVDCVEVDPALPDLAQRHRYDTGRPLATGPRLRVVSESDPRRFLKTCRAQYDVIILAAPNPSSGLLNRFYTREFFQEARRALTPGGVFALQIEGAPDYMNPPHLALAATVHRTLASAFGTVSPLPADHAIHFFATPERRRPFPNAAAMQQRLALWRIPHRWITPQTLAEMTHPQRAGRLYTALQRAPPLPVNTDLRPMAYLHTLRLWAEAFEVKGRDTLNAALRLTLPHVLMGVVVLTILIGILLIVLPQPRPAAMMAVRVYAGMAGFMLEMTLLFTLQGLHGSAYGFLGLLFAAFMAGLMAGATLAWPMGAPRGETQVLMLLQIALAILAASTGVLLYLLAGRGAAVVPLAVPFLNFWAGVLVGAQYPLSVAACADPAADPRGSPYASALYAMDLVGACIGALAAGTFLLPVLGLPGTCWVVAALCLATLPLLFLADRRAPA